MNMFMKNWKTNLKAFVIKNTCASSFHSQEFQSATIGKNIKIEMGPETYTVGTLGVI